MINDIRSAPARIGALFCLRKKFGLTPRRTKGKLNMYGQKPEEAAR